MSSSFSEEDAIFTARIKNAVADPFVKAPPKFSLGRRIYIEAIGVPLITLLLAFLCGAVDVIFQNVYSGGKYYVVDMATQMWLPSVDPAQSKKLLNAILLAMSVMFGILLSIVGLVLDMASSKFTKTNISNVFFRDKFVLGAIAYVVTANIVSFFTYASIGEEEEGGFIPRFSIIIATVLVLTLLTGVIPFMNYLFVFLDAQLVVAKINTIGFNGLKEACQDRNGAHVGEHQRKAVESIEHLRDASYRSLRKRDKTISSLTVDGLCSFVIHYSKTKNEMFKHWHIIPRWMRQSPDFLALPDDFIEDITYNRVWVEWKALRQYLELYNESIVHAEEVCYHIAMNTRAVAQVCGIDGEDIHTLDLCLKFFNTYLRSGINKKAIRVTSNLLLQYRKLGEYCIEKAAYLKQKYANSDSNGGEKYKLAIAVEERVIRIGKYLRYYSFFALQTKVEFLVEVVAQEMRVLCECALSFKGSVHDQLLEIFLSIYDQSENGPDKAIRGVRKAQLCLVSAYVLLNKHQYVQRLKDELQTDSLQRISQIVKELDGTELEWWEVSERGSNLNWISDEQKVHLRGILQWFK